MPSLADIFLRHRGNASDKWEQYLRVYDLELHDFRAAGTPLTLLEIGVQNGGSLEIWKKFLPEGSRIFGVDIDPAVQSVPFSDGITVVTCDAADVAAVTALTGQQTFDLIIDDGSHRSADVIAGFEGFFPLLAPRGKYFIEDLHASYYPGHGGGYREPGSSVEYMKSLIDALHRNYSGDAAAAGGGNSATAIYLAMNIARVAFYDSIAVVDKSDIAKSSPFRRVLTGDRWTVVPVQDAFVQGYPTADSVFRLSETALKCVETHLVAELEATRAALHRAERTLEAQAAEIARLRAPPGDREEG